MERDSATLQMSELREHPTVNHRVTEPTSVRSMSSPKIAETRSTHAAVGSVVTHRMRQERAAEAHLSRVLGSTNHPVPPGAWWGVRTDGSRQSICLGDAKESTCNSYELENGVLTRDIGSQGRSVLRRVP